MQTKFQDITSHSNETGEGQGWGEKVTKWAREKTAKFSQNLQRMGGENRVAERKGFKKETVGKCESALRRSQILVGGRDEMIASRGHLSPDLKDQEPP